MRSKRGFSLIELLVYVSILAGVGGLLTGILYNSTRITNRETASTEVSQQLNFVLGTIQRLVGDSSLIEKAYVTEGNIDPTDDVLFSQCESTSSYCTLMLRFENDVDDPTWIVATSTGVYMVRGDDNEGDEPLALDNATTTLLTTSRITTDYLRFTKYEFGGGHASAQIDMAFTYNTENPKFNVSKSIASAVGRVHAAYFDDSLIPNTNDAYDIGTLSNKWANAHFSGALLVDDYISLTETTAPAPATGYGRLYVNSSDNNLYYVPESGTSTAITFDDGRGLTLDSGTLAADAELYTDTKCLWMANPTDSDDLQSIWTANGFAATITKIWCESDQSVVADLMVDDDTPAAVNGTNLTCDTTPDGSEAPAGDTTLADGDRLDLAISSTSGSPTWLSLCWTVTYDD